VMAESRDVGWTPTGASTRSRSPWTSRTKGEPQARDAVRGDDHARERGAGPVRAAAGGLQRRGGALRLHSRRVSVRACARAGRASVRDSGRAHRWGPGGRARAGARAGTGGGAPDPVG
jgi:hypothetical protein